MKRAELDYLDMTAKGFSTRGPEVVQARRNGWAARTPYGLAILRHWEAGNILRDRRFRQGSHNWPELLGLEGSFADFWCRSVIALEGPEHKYLRRVAQNALSIDFIHSLRGNFNDIASELIEDLRGRGTIEAIHDFTEPFAGRAIATLLGLDASHAQSLGWDASRLGLAMGQEGKAHEPVFNAACDRLMDLARRLIDRTRSGEDKTSLVARLVSIWDEEDQKNDTPLVDLIVISIFGGVDTTRAQLGFGMSLFAQFPDQWDHLRADPDLIPQAIDEVIRTWPTTTWATRQATETFVMDGIDIFEGDIVHVFVNASGRDPTVIGDDAFDITQKRKIHFGFGGGAHNCLGQHVARTDMSEALREMARNWRGIEFAGEAEFLPDSGNTSPLRLPMRLVWAS